MKLYVRLKRTNQLKCVKKKKNMKTFKKPFGFSFHVLMDRAECCSWTRYLLQDG